MTKVYGEWVPDVNFAELQECMSIAVAFKPSRLTGNELRFLRQRMEFTIPQMAKFLLWTQKKIRNYEQTADRNTGMPLEEEKLLRLRILDALDVEGDLLKAAIAKLGEKLPARKTAFRTSANLIKNRKKFLNSAVAGTLAA